MGSKKNPPTDSSFVMLAGKDSAEEKQFDIQAPSVAGKRWFHAGLDDSAAWNLLNTFLTHTDGRPVYGFRNLPPEFIAALFARYSRTDKDIAQVCLDALVDAGVTINDRQFKILSDLRNKLTGAEKTQAFHRKYTIDFGHGSIRKMASGIPIAIDRASMFAATFISGNIRKGFQCVERSSRYQKKFFDPNNIVKAEALFPGEEHEAVRVKYTALMHACIKTAKQVYNHLMEAYKAEYPYDADKTPEVDEKTWNKWLRNRALDNSRYMLPVASITGLGFTANATAINRLVSKCVNHPSSELKMLGHLIHDAASDIAPVLVKEPAINMQDIKESTYGDNDIARFRQHIVDTICPDDVDRLYEPKNIGDMCIVGLDRPHMSNDDLFVFLASTLVAKELVLPVDAVYPWFKAWVMEGTLPPELYKLSEFVGRKVESGLDFALKLIYKYSGHYNDDGQIVNTRGMKLKKLDDARASIVGYEPLPKVFELVDLTYDMVLDFGAWRDLARHKVLSRIDYPLFPSLGFSYPDDVNLLPEQLRAMFGELFAMSVDLFEQIATTKGLGVNMAQYAGLNMWNQRRIMHMNLRELDHIVALRTRWSGHHSYRRIAKMMYYRALEIWPQLGQFFKVDINNYVFGRMQRKEEEAAS